MPVTTTPSVTSDTQILAPSGARKGFTIVNTDANRLYVLFGSSASSATKYTLYLDTGDVYECATERCYTGEIRGIWASDGSGSAIVTTWGA